jgi:hypothetical protein
MRRTVTICKKIESTLESSFLIVGFALNNLPFPDAANNFRPSGNDVSFTFGVVSHDGKLKLMKRRY